MWIKIKRFSDAVLVGRRERKGREEEKDEEQYSVEENRYGERKEGNLNISERQIRRQP